METIQYVIDNKAYHIKVEGSPEFFYGKNERLSNSKTDITYGQEWYEEGFKALNFLNKSEFKSLYDGLTRCIAKILSSYIDNLDDFELEKYHKYVTTDELHYQVVSVTRDLFPEDFNFPIEAMITKFENLVGFKLTDINPHDRKQVHIIMRINRPGSTDYNPPHKDIYEGVDIISVVPQFVNLWIPICGVTEKSTLPIAPSSHLCTEDKVLRTFEGGVVEGKKYRVRTIKEWNGQNKMIRPVVDYGEVLVFSSHLIHGLAINEQDDETRVALEFRLFKK
jgi:hypothetical protein